MNHTRIFYKDQECQLQHVCQKANGKHCIWARNDTQAIVKGIANSVHGMGKHLENTIKCQILVEQKEKVTPI